MTTFGKRGRTEVRPMAESHRIPQHVSAFRHDDQRPTDDDDRAEERIRFFSRVAGWSGGAYLLLVCSWGAVITTTGQSIVPLWLLLALGGILFVIAVLSSVIAGVGRSRRPKGLLAYMHKNPSVYILGTCFGLAGFALFSQHSLEALFSDFSLSKVLLLEPAAPGERRPWADLAGFVAAGWLAVGALFYSLSKMADDGESTS
jgi:hypothetical protein